MRTTVAERRPCTAGGTQQRAYPLGYSEDEFKRLEQQNTLYMDFTEDVLRRAGLAPGMRVLDLGCGVGDVTQLAAWLVGPSGAVLGIDRSAESVSVATWRAASAGQDWVRFATAEIDAFSTHETFDAVIGRLVLMYLPNPAATLRRLCRHVRTGGVVAFQELVMPLARSVPEGAQFRQCLNWILDTFARGGFECDMGGKLLATFLAAGLPAPQMVVAGRAEGGPQSPVYDYIANTLRSLLPAVERMGVATAAEVDIDTVAERLRKEAVENHACIMPPPFVGAWTRLPA
jgi:ubiquinone/menaquinone biosynthesis C-methylase UbiE